VKNIEELVLQRERERALAAGQNYPRRPSKSSRTENIVKRSDSPPKKNVNVQAKKEALLQKYGDLPGVYNNNAPPEKGDDSKETIVRLGF